MDKALQLPGVANSWTMPIKARIDMLSTGIGSLLARLGQTAQTPSERAYQGDPEAVALWKNEAFLHMA